MKVIWKPVQALNIKNNIVWVDPCDTKNTMLDQILTLPKLKPISYEMAVSLAWDETTDFFRGLDSEASDAMANIPFFVATLGYSIELKPGDYEILPE